MPTHFSSKCSNNKFKKEKYFIKLLSERVKIIQISYLDHQFQNRHFNFISYKLHNITNQYSMLYGVKFDICDELNYHGWWVLLQINQDSDLTIVCFFKQKIVLSKVKIMMTFQFFEIRDEVFKKFFLKSIQISIFVFLSLVTSSKMLRTDKAINLIHI